MKTRREFLRTSALGVVGAGVTRADARTPSLIDDHQLAEITFRRVGLPWPREVGRNATRGHHGRGPTVTVAILKTDQGAMGWGELQATREEVEAVRDAVIGKSVAALIDPAAGIRAPELHGIDIPLHDLAGVILGQPVWKMMGARKPFVTQIYSGMIYLDDLDPEDHPAGIDKVIENCRWDHAYGYRQLKLKIGRGHQWMPPEAGLQRDIEVTRAVHDAFPDVDILVDGNNGFPVEMFIRYLEGIEDIPLFWVEEPFHETLQDWTRLGSWMMANGRADTYRADGEARPDFAVLEALERTHILTLRLNDICGHGFTRWRRLMPSLERSGIAASPHTWGSALKTVYAAHLAAALGNTPTLEGVTSVDSDVDFGENRIVEGRFQLSAQPGFGLSLPDAGG